MLGVRRRRLAPLAALAGGRGSEPKGAVRKRLAPQSANRRRHTDPCSHPTLSLPPSHATTTTKPTPQQLAAACSGHRDTTAASPFAPAPAKSLRIVVVAPPSSTSATRRRAQPLAPLLAVLARLEQQQHNQTTRSPPPATELILRRLALSDADALLVASALRALPSLATLDLSHNAVSDEGAAALGQALLLGLGSTRRTSAASSALNTDAAAAATPGGLTRLCLRGNAITSEGVGALAAGVAGSSSLRELDLADNLACNCSGLAFVLAAAGAAESTGNSSSSLSPMPSPCASLPPLFAPAAEAEGAAVTALRARSWPTAPASALASSVLMLSSSSLSPPALLYAAGAPLPTAFTPAEDPTPTHTTTTSCPLRCLDLSGNPVSDDCARAFAAALRAGGRLSWLGLARARVGLEGARALAAAASATAAPSNGSSPLVALRLDDATLPPDEALALAGALAERRAVLARDDPDLLGGADMFEASVLDAEEEQEEQVRWQQEQQQQRRRRQLRAGEARPWPAAVAAATANTKQHPPVVRTSTPPSLLRRGSSSDGGCAALSLLPSSASTTPPRTPPPATPPGADSGSVASASSAAQPQGGSLSAASSMSLPSSSSNAVVAAAPSNASNTLLYNRPRSPLLPPLGTGVGAGASSSPHPAGAAASSSSPGAMGRAGSGGGLPPLPPGTRRQPRASLTAALDGIAAEVVAAVAAAAIAGAVDDDDAPQAAAAAPPRQWLPPPPQKTLPLLPRAASLPSPAAAPRLARTASCPFLPSPALLTPLAASAAAAELEADGIDALLSVEPAALRARARLEEEGMW